MVSTRRSTKRLVDQDIRAVLHAITTAKATSATEARMPTSTESSSTSTTAETTPVRCTRGQEQVASSMGTMLGAKTPRRREGRM